MAENIFSSFAISGQGLSVQRMRLSSVAKNIANANTTHDENGEPYKREIVIARAKPESFFDRELQQQITLVGTNGNHAGNSGFSERPDQTVAVQAIASKDASPPRKMYDPSHPDADADGYVEMPNVNIVTEMVEMISAQRAFEANTSVFAAAKNIAKESLEI